MKKCLLVFGLVLGLVPVIALAVDFKDISETLMTPTIVITKMLIFACYVVGAALIVASVAQYRNHLQTPKLVPLTTPVMLLVLGIGLLLLPYASTLVKETGSAAEQAKREGRDKSPPSRLVGPKSERSELGPGSLPPDEPEESYDDLDYDQGGSSGGGSWTDQYR